MLLPGSLTPVETPTGETPAFTSERMLSAVKLLEDTLYTAGIISDRERVHADPPYVTECPLLPAHWPWMPMTPGGAASAIVLDATAAGLLGWATLVGYRNRDRPNAPMFTVLLGALTAWAVVALGGEIGGVLWGERAAGAIEFTSLLPALFAPVAWTVYILGYAGRGTKLTRRRMLLLAGAALPVVFGVAGVVVIALNPSESEGSLILAVLLSLLVAALLYILASLVYSSFVLARLGYRHAALSTAQIAVLLGGIGSPYLDTVLGRQGIVDSGATAGLLVSGVLFTLAVHRYPVLTGFPASESVARTRVVESLQEAVVVLSWEGKVLDANESMTEFFGTSTDELVGESIQSAARGLADADLSVGNTGRVTLTTVDGRRRFQYSVSAVTAHTERDRDETDPVARAVVLRDVTERQTREQRLTVLNRILRHNVRNQLDVVLANARHVSEESLRAGIRDSATELVELSDKAREAEQIMAASTGMPERVDLVAVVRDVVDEYRGKTSDCNITTTGPSKVSIVSHRAVVRTLIAELVENAVTHTEEPPANVEVTVRTSDDQMAEVVVADDGPGIPEQEQEVLVEETEEPLKHGRGIGLWIVKWGVTRLGGEVSISENEPQGSVVSVRLPRGVRPAREQP
jgi:PAS domain S-box-containing protein